MFPLSKYQEMARNWNLRTLSLQPFCKNDVLGVESNLGDFNIFAKTTCLAGEAIWATSSILKTNSVFGGKLQMVSILFGMRIGNYIGISD